MKERTPEQAQRPDMEFGPARANPAAGQPCDCTEPAIIRRSRGVAYNVQKTYANWHRGIRRGK